MVSALVPGLSGPGSSPDQEHTVVFLGMTLNFHSASTKDYEWVPINCWGNLTNCREVTWDEQASCPEGVELLLATSCYRNLDKLPSYEPVRSMVSHFFGGCYLYGLYKGVQLF